MELPSEISKPVTKKGVPNTWLTIMIPFLKKKSCTKKEIMKLFGVNESNWKTRRNSCNKPLTAMVKVGILSTENKGPATLWHRGPEFSNFLGQVVLELANNHKNKENLINLFFKGDTDNNALDFLSRLSLED